jgi:predicted dehydrogenase
VGLHLFDLSRHLVGEARTLSCRTQRLNPIVKGEDAFTALVGHDNGATSVVDCSFFSKLTPHRFPQTTAWIEGDRGTIDLDEDFRMTVHGPDGRQSFDVAPPVPSWGGKPWHIIQDSVIAFCTHVVDILDGRAQPQPSGADNLRTLTMSLAAYEAAATDRVINLRTWKEAR